MCKTIIVLDWDGTLCPTPQLKSILKRVRQRRNPEIHQRIHMFLDNTSQWLASLFDFIESNQMSGCIVTDSPHRWVHCVCKFLFPRLLPYLTSDRINVCHTTDMRNQLSGLSPVERLCNSKLPTFSSILKDEDLVDSQGVKPRLISIGDSVMEHLAASECLKLGLVSQIRIVKFQTKLSLQTWQDQIVHLEALLKTFKDSDSSMSTSHRWSKDTGSWVCEQALPKMGRFHSPTRNPTRANQTMSCET